MVSGAGFTIEAAITLASLKDQPGLNVAIMKQNLNWLSRYYARDNPIHAISLIYIAAFLLRALDNSTLGRESTTFILLKGDLIDGQYYI